MKKTKHPGLSRKDKRNLRIQARRVATKDRAAKVLNTAFGMHSQAPPPIDVALSARLRAALQQIDYDLNDACQQRGILSSGIADALYMAGFLAYVLPSARAAQDLTGIRASLMLADAFIRTAADATATNDIFGTGKDFASLFDAFMDRAITLNKNSALKAKVMNDRDVQNCIKQFGLTECDQLHGLY